MGDLDNLYSYYNNALEFSGRLQRYRFAIQKQQFQTDLQLLAQNPQQKQNFRFKNNVKSFIKSKLQKNKSPTMEKISLQDMMLSQSINYSIHKPHNTPIADKTFQVENTQRSTARMLELSLNDLRLPTTSRSNSSTHRYNMPRQF